MATVYVAVVEHLKSIQKLVILRAARNYTQLVLLLLLSMSQKEDPAVTNFREYVRINTMHPDPDYGESHFRSY